MLPDLILALPLPVRRWLSRTLGVDAGLHEWVPFLCACPECDLEPVTGTHPKE